MYIRSFCINIFINPSFASFASSFCISSSFGASFASSSASISKIEEIIYIVFLFYNQGILFYYKERERGDK